MIKTHIIYSTKYQVVVGSLGYGFKFYGLFNGKQIAQQWADQSLMDWAPFTIQPVNIVPED